MKTDINNRATLYTATESPSTVIIFSHGSSGDRNTDFMDSISKSLVETRADIGVVTYDFSFADHAEPSISLFDEVAVLRNQIDWVQNRFPHAAIFLAGKSIGGVVSLIYQAEEKNSTVKGIFMLGMPFKLGFPPKLQLLKEQKPVLPDYVSEYASLFKQVLIPVHIVQGDSDDLCGVDELKQFVAGYSNVNCRIMVGANHGFLSADKKKNYFSDCVSEIINNI